MSVQHCTAEGCSLSVPVMGGQSYHKGMCILIMSIAGRMNGVEVKQLLLSLSDGKGALCWLLCPWY